MKTYQISEQLLNKEIEINGEWVPFGVLEND